LVQRWIEAAGIFVYPESGQWYGPSGWSLVTWEMTQDLLKLFGPVVTGLLILLWLNKTGQLRWGREADQFQKDTETLRKDYEQRLAEQRRDYEQRLTDMTTDRDYYRDETLDLLRHLGGAASTSESAVSTAVRSLRRS
jgi:hypothetical protein